MHYIEHARAVLPWWVTWGPALVYLPLTFLVSWAGCRLTAAITLRPFLRYRGEEWTERARLAFPCRFAAGVQAPCLTLLAGSVGALLAGRLLPLPAGWFCVALGAAAFLPAWRENCRVGRVLGMPGAKRPVTERLRSAAVLSVFLLPPLLVVLLAAFVMPSWFGLSTLLVMLTVTMAYTVSGGGFLILLSIRLGLVRHASPRLAGIVEEVAARCGVRPRFTLEMPWTMANAAALPTVQGLVFTDALLREFDDSEIAAVCAHEMAHLTEPARVLRARMASSYVLLPLALTKPVFATFGGLGFLALAFATLFALVFVISRFRPMEERADEAGRRSDPVSYARALEKLYRANLMPATTNGRWKSHPDLYDRLIAAGVEPPYPRPKAPSRTLALTAVVPVLSLAVALLAPMLSARFWVDRAPKSETAALCEVAVSGHPYSLESLAHLRYDRRNPTYLSLLGAAAEMAPTETYLAAAHAQMLAREGRCAEARSMLDEAWRRARRYGMRGGRTTLWSAGAALAACQKAKRGGD